MISLDERARAFNQTSVVNAGRTRRLASSATKTQIKMADRIVVEFDASFGERLHQIDSPTRRVHLASSRDVGGTALGAESAVNTVEQQLVFTDIAKRRR
jgi:hypothetical protein